MKTLLYFVACVLLCIILPRIVVTALAAVGVLLILGLLGVVDIEISSDDYDHDHE